MSRPGLLAILLPQSGGPGSALVVHSIRSCSLLRPLLERYAEETGTDFRVCQANTASFIAA